MEGHGRTHPPSGQHHLLMVGTLAYGARTTRLGTVSLSAASRILQKGSIARLLVFLMHILG